MAKEPSKKAQAWVFFDRIVADAAPAGVHSIPWVVGQDGQVRFQPDYDTLARLLGVPLHLKAGTQSGVPALALDVWLSYELRRSGFKSDEVWPRPTNPRILPASVAALIKSLPGKLRAEVGERVTKKTSITGVTSASANILGKNYVKQVDVVITDGWTGPELLVSTKRMDSSYGKNAPNRIEESYGDAKNLRLRHPLAALGFVFGLRSDILEKAPNVAEWLFDLLTKLGREDDAYHATCLVLIEYADSVAPPEEEAEPDEAEPAFGILEPGPEPEDSQDVDEEEDAPASIPGSTVDAVIATLPTVSIRMDRTPAELDPARFLASIVTRVLETTPVNMHQEARRRRDTASSDSGAVA